MSIDLNEVREQERTTADERERDVSQAVTESHNLLMLMEETVARLQERLTPVLASLPGERADPPLLEASVCELAGRIRGTNNRLSGQHVVLVEILARLEV